MRHRPAAVGALLALALVPAGGAPAARAQETRGAGAGAAVSDSVAVSARYRFHSGFWLNFYNFLNLEAKRRKGVDDFGLGGRGNLALDTLPARPPTPEERRRWDEAVDLYRSVVLAAPEPDSVVTRVNDRLAAAGDSPPPRDLPIDPAVWRAVLDAAPVYRVLWWPGHDARNRAWIAAEQALLARHGEALSRRLAATLRSPWPEDGLPVDATVYASWFGAYTTLRPPHLTVSSSAVGSQGSWGLEVLVHEAGHVLLAPVDSAIAATARRLDRPPPRQLAHMILFYTAGELVRDAVPGHVPYAEEFGIWRQNGSAERYHALLCQEWQPYLDGRRSFELAVERLVRRWAQP